MKHTRYIRQPKAELKELILEHLLYYTLKTLKIEYFDGSKRHTVTIHEKELYEIDDADEYFYKEVLDVWLTNAHGVKMEIKRK